jgi:RecB family exonuclease
MRLSASQLGSYARCPRAFAYERLEGKPGRLLSATAFGSVMHHVLHAVERALVDGGKTMAEATEMAHATFDYYWHPQNIETITDGPIEEWIKNQNYAGLRQRGHEVIDRYLQQRLDDDLKVLSLEHPFEVPIVGTEHTISGYVDKMGERKRSRNWTLEFEDYKSGKRQFGLRHNLQLGVYAYASTQIGFWEPFAALGFDPQELWEGYAEWPRHVVWFDMDGTDAKGLDGGYRGERDYHRLAVAANDMARAIEANIFPLRISGETCQYCPHRSYCPDGTGLPGDDEYDPNRQPIFLDRGE